MPEADGLCASCRERPAAYKKPRYCRECWRRYLKAWRQLARQRQQLRDMRRGAELARVALIRAFRLIGRKEMNGYTAAEIVRAAAVEL